MFGILRLNTGLWTCTSKATWHQNCNSAYCQMHNYVFFLCILNLLYFFLQTVRTFCLILKHFDMIMCGIYGIDAFGKWSHEMWPLIVVVGSRPTSQILRHLLSSTTSKGNLVTCHKGWWPFGRRKLSENFHLRNNSPPPKFNKVQSQSFHCWR